MAAATEPLLMTVEQYRQLPDREDVIQELHWGMVVTLSRPKMSHAKLQSRLVRLLRPKAEHLGVVESEVAFRALPEYDLRGAEVRDGCCDRTFIDDRRAVPPVAGSGRRHPGTSLGDGGHVVATQDEPRQAAVSFSEAATAKSGAPGCRRIRGRLQGASRVRSAERT